MHPRVFIFGPMGAWLPSWPRISSTLSTSWRERVNNDARIQGKLKVVFMPKLPREPGREADPGAAMSPEQISTAGHEARHRQHEDGTERRHHHRNPGWCQHRDR